MASYYALHSSQVTVINAGSHSGAADGNIPDSSKNYEKKGHPFHAQLRVANRRKCSSIRAGGCPGVEADKVLMSVGRRPATEGRGLEASALSWTGVPSGLMKDARPMCPGLCSRRCSGYPCWPFAYRESEVAINNMLGEGCCAIMP